MAVQVKQHLLDQVTNYISNLAVKAVLTVDNVDKDYDIFRTKISDGVVRKYIYIDDQIGHITKARLIDNQRRDLIYSDVNIKKLDDGLMVLFTIKLTVGGGVTQ